MRHTFNWCKDKTRLSIYDKQVFCEKYGSRYWYLNGKRHRADGPAIEYEHGNKYWYLNDKLHRENGPAIELANGNKEWYLNGKRHREDGPAVEHAAVYPDAHPDDGKWWYLNGKYYTETDFWSELKK